MSSKETEYVDGLNVDQGLEDLTTTTALDAMRSIRQSRGLSLEDVATRLKFAPRQVEAFESAQWEAFPDGIGLRVLARNYTKMLGVEMHSIEHLLPAHKVRGGLTVASHRGVGTDRDLGLAMEPEETTRSWPWLVVILLVVAVVVGIAIWQGVLPEDAMPSWVREMWA